MHCYTNMRWTLHVQSVSLAINAQQQSGKLPQSIASKLWTNLCGATFVACTSTITTQKNGAVTWLLWLGFSRCGLVWLMTSRPSKWLKHYDASSTRAACRLQTANSLTRWCQERCQLNGHTQTAGLRCSTWSLRPCSVT